MSKLNADRLGEIEKSLEDVNYDLGTYIDQLRKEDDPIWEAYAELSVELDEIIDKLTDATNNFIEETK